MSVLRQSLLAAVASLAGLVGAAQAQIGERVAAVVNDRPISTLDVRQRMLLLSATEGIPLSEQTAPLLQERALRDLIEQNLKLSEAAEYDLEVPNEAISEELSRIAASAGTTLPQMEQDLRAQGIDISTLAERVRADEAWKQLVRGRYGSRVNVTEDEIQAAVDDLQNTATSQQFLVSEICLPVTDPSQAEQMQAIGMQMIEQMRQGVPFRAVAQQYSGCPTAARGGDLGWLALDQFEPAIRATVEQLGPGNISRPVPSQGMLKLIAVRDRRDAAPKGMPSYEVAYAGAPLSVGRARAEEAFTKLAAANPCSGNALSVDLGPDIGVTVLPMVPQSEFEPAFHPTLASLERGDSSGLIEVDGAYHAILLCEKDDGYGLPSRRTVESRLRAEELDLLSRRYLRDVERDSAVVIRNASQDS